MTIIGLDIGGANLKAADGQGRAVQVPFALWKNPDRLEREIGAILENFGRPEAIALTMTGELCDCFASKSDGVRRIATAVERAAPRVPLRIWTTDGLFVPPQLLEAEPRRAAAVNWLALATFAGRFAPSGSALVIDLGSTTCDIVPLLNGKPQPLGRTDPARMASSELLYTGVRRTPVCAILGTSVAAEFFATTQDVYVALGDLPEEPGRADTADARPLTLDNCYNRLARMKCDEGWGRGRAEEFSRSVRHAQVQRIALSAMTVASWQPHPIANVVFAGAGEFLLGEVIASTTFHDAQSISLAQRLGPALSTAACAHAVAVLAAEEM